MGATISMVLAEAFVFIIQVFSLRHVLKNVLKIKIIGKVIFSSLLAIILPVVINFHLSNYLLSLISSSIVFFISYSLMLIFFKEPLILNQLHRMIGKFNER